MVADIFRKRILTRCAAATVSVLTACALVACGGEGQPAAGGEGTDGKERLDAVSAGDLPELDGGPALDAVKAAAEDFGYANCLVGPAISTEDLREVIENPEDATLDDSPLMLTCLGSVDDMLPRIGLHDRNNLASGQEAVEAELDDNLGPDSELVFPREKTAMDYRAFDGDGVVGFCVGIPYVADDIERTSCEDVADALNLESGTVDYAWTDDELDAWNEAENQRRHEEWEREQEAEKAALQDYTGWADMEEAREQLRAWDFSCSDALGEEGTVSWCELFSVIVSFGPDADDLDRLGVFDDVGRDRMMSVSDGDWLMLCARGSWERCEFVADKTGRPVEDNV